MVLGARFLLFYLCWGEDKRGGDIEGGLEGGGWLVHAGCERGGGGISEVFQKCGNPTPPPPLPLTPPPSPLIPLLAPSVNRANSLLLQQKESRYTPTYIDTV